MKTIKLFLTNLLVGAGSFAIFLTLNTSLHDVLVGNDIFMAIMTTISGVNNDLLKKFLGLLITFGFDFIILFHICAFLCLCFRKAVFENQLLFYRAISMTVGAFLVDKIVLISTPDSVGVLAYFQSLEFWSVKHSTFFMFITILACYSSVLCCFRLFKTSDTKKIE